MRCRGLAHLLAAAAVMWSVVVCLPVGARAADTETEGPAAQQLAEEYAPVIVLRRHDEICGSTGEPYVPMTVDAVLGNPEVALRQVGNGDQVIMWAPTAKDLYGRGQGVYLDLPGDALQPGCIYASDSARYTPLSRSAVYAHIAQQADRPGFLAVQYWIYWYYNDWNDKHEGDWEFVQVLFRASSVQEALSKQPSSVGYAQHTGGEVSDWTADKLRREGTHPVVYSSQGSHASYVEPALFLGRGATEGFGCDNTQAPSTTVRPRVVLLPDAASGPDDPFAWLAFDGRWGERQPSPNDGPTGPAAKHQWSAPVDWQDGLRPSAFVVPGGSAAAPQIIDTFCKVVGKGSVIFIDFLSSPGKVLGVLAVLVAALVFLLQRTSWRRVDPLPVVMRRRAGEIVRASVGLYRARPLTFAALGLIAVPIAVLAAVVTAVLNHLPVLGEPATVADAGAPGSRLLVSSAVAAAFWPLTVLLVSAAVTWVLDSDPPHASSRRAVRAVATRSWDLASSFLLAVVIVALLSLTVIGAPIAVWLTVRFQFLAQVTMLEGLRSRQALARSGALVRHRWLHTALVAALVWVVVQVVALGIGLLLLVAFTGLPLWSVSLAVVGCQVVLTPLGAIVLTLLYGDACAEHGGRVRPADGRVLSDA
ncbi:MAG: Vps62-related protein [Actinomycetes bacterium]